MKSSSQSSKSSVNSKSKKSSKDRDKRKSQGSSDINNHNSNEKGTPTKETSNRQYVGLDNECLNNYGEQVAEHYLSEEISNTLSEDINYKLRYILNDALLKARLQGRNAISSLDLAETFENLGLDRVYGAPSSPEWIPFGYQNLYLLNDTQVNLIAMAESENFYVQPGDPLLFKTWVPEQPEISKSLKNYFVVICESVVSNDAQLRKAALKNIQENSQIGPIVEWLYNFGYILLSKDITYDCLTLRALDLIQVLENTTISRISVSERLLRLLIRLILQRLLKSHTNIDVLQPMCYTLAALCIRMPLKEFVTAKIAQKLGEICRTYSVPVLCIIKNLGSDTIKELFLPNMNLFLTRVMQMKEPDLIFSILEIFNIMYKNDMIDSIVYNAFYEIFGDVLVIFSRAVHHTTDKGSERMDINFIKIKSQLFKLQQKRKIKKRNYNKVDCVPFEEIIEEPTKPKPRTTLPLKNIHTVKHSDLWKPLSIKGSFDTSNPRKLTPEKELLKITWKKRQNQIANSSHSSTVNETDIIIGKTSLLLPVLKQKRNQIRSKCCDHSLLSYNI